MAWRGLTAAAAGALLALWGAPAGAAQQRVLLVVLPEAEARGVLARHGAAVGIGYGVPEGMTFVEEAGAAIRDGLADRGVRVAFGAADDAPASLREAVRPLVSLGDPAPPTGAVRASVAVEVLSGSEQAEDLIARTRARVILVGASPGTRALVADLSLHGFLVAGRRPAVVAPADAAATFLTEAGAASGGVWGARPLSEPLRALDRLAGRFARDEATRGTLVVALGALGGPAALALLARRRRWTARLGVAASFGALGFVGALFVDDGRGWVRAVPLAIATVLGLLVPPRHARRVVAVVLLALGAGVGALAVAAALRPGGEPALSLWGSPGARAGLDAVLVSLMGGGLVGGAALLRRWRVT